MKEKRKVRGKKERIKEREWVRNCLSYNDGTEEAKEEEGWLGGRVFEEGSGESLIPRFHQCVQIWRHLLLHEACSQDPPLTREKTGGEQKGGG